jgi:hypothetical protein
MEEKYVDMKISLSDLVTLLRPSAGQGSREMAKMYALTH